MTEIRRQMMLRIADGAPEATRPLYYLDRLTRCDEILCFMLTQRLTGRKFIDSLNHEHDGSILEFAKWAIMRIDRNLEKKPILFGRDFRR